MLQIILIVLLPFRDILTRQFWRTKRLSNLIALKLEPKYHSPFNREFAFNLPFKKFA